MNIEHLIQTYPELLKQMAQDGYSNDYIKSVGFEIKWLIRQQSVAQELSYLELLEIRIATGRSSVPSLNRIYRKRSVFTVIQRFEENGEFPNRKKKEPIVKKAAYWELNHNFRTIIDMFKQEAQEKGYAETTIKKCISKCSCFFLYLQNLGYSSLNNISEHDVLFFFTDRTGNLIKSRSYKRDIECVLSSDSFSHLENTSKIKSFLPAIKKRRRTIQYLTPTEFKKIQTILEESSSILTQRDIAVGMLLFYTGMRAIDISNLRFYNIDWNREIIRFNQSKTSGLVEIPLRPNVGNALFEYITTERPSVQDNHIFLWEKPPYHPIDATVIWPITSHICKAASIRQSPGDRKGSHIFRHHLATYLASKNTPQPIISEILGHESPTSLDFYLSADIEHLRECALSIDLFPVREGLF